MDESPEVVSTFHASVARLAQEAATARDRESNLAVAARSAALRADLDDVIQALVTRAREAGATWQNVGDSLGTTRQAAFQRFGRPIDPRTGEPMSTTPAKGATSVAAAVIDDLTSARWDAVVTRFDQRVSEALNADELAATWARVIASLGAFEGAEAASAKRTADVTVVETVLRHEAGEVVARLAIRDDLSIAGLFFLEPADSTESAR